MRNPVWLTISIATAACLLVSASGCQRAAIEYREVKGTNEKVTEAELNQFLRIVDSLPDKKLPKLPTVMRTLPNWSAERTLPVKELVNEERKLLNEGWSVESIAAGWKQNGALQRTLQREGITLEQFIGVTLALGASLSRTTIRADQDLQDILKRGRIEVARLRKREGTFSKLSPHDRHAVLRQAGWITRVDRAERLKDVPPENIALVRESAERIKALLPAEFSENPFDSVADRLEEQGIPFEELAETGRDDEITWNPDEKLSTSGPPSTGATSNGSPTGNGGPMP